jgi:hypothetical protein
MNAERTLIISVAFLALGLGLIFGFCHGNAGFSAAYPPSGASFQLSLTTTGLPAEGGFAATVIGVVLLLPAFSASHSGAGSAASCGIQTPRQHGYLVLAIA